MLHGADYHATSMHEMSSLVEQDDFSDPAFLSPLNTEWRPFRAQGQGKGRGDR